MSIKQSLNQLETLFSGVSEPDVPVEPRSKPRRASDSASAPSGWVWEFDADGNSLWCSDEIQPLLGVRPSQIHGQPLEFCGLLPDSAQRLRSAIAEGEPIDNLFLSANHRNGAPIMLLLNALPRMNEDGEPSTYRAVVQVLQGGNAAPAPAKARKAAPAPKEVPPVVAPNGKRPVGRAAATQVAPPPTAAVPQPAAPAKPRPSAAKSSAAVAPAKAGAPAAIPGAQKFAPAAKIRRQADEAVQAEVEKFLRKPAEAMPAGAARKPAVKPQLSSPVSFAAEVPTLAQTKRRPSKAPAAKEIAFPVAEMPAAAPTGKRTVRPAIKVELAALETPAPARKRAARMQPAAAATIAMEAPAAPSKKRPTKFFAPVEPAPVTEAPKAPGRKRLTKPFVAEAMPAPATELPAKPHRQPTRPFATTEAQPFIEVPATVIKKRPVKPISAIAATAPAAGPAGAPKKRITKPFVPAEVQTAEPAQAAPRKRTKPFIPAEAAPAAEPPAAPKKRITKPFAEAAISETPPPAPALKRITKPFQKPRAVPSITSLLESAAEPAPEKRIRRPTLEELLPTIAPSLRKISEVEEPEVPIEPAVESEAETAVTFQEPTIPSPVIIPLMPEIESAAPAFTPPAATAEPENLAVEKPAEAVLSEPIAAPPAEETTASILPTTAVPETPKPEAEEVKPKAAVPGEPAPMFSAITEEVSTEPARPSFDPHSIGTRQLSPSALPEALAAASIETAFQIPPKAEPPAAPIAPAAAVSALPNAVPAIPAADQRIVPPPAAIPAREETAAPAPAQQSIPKPPFRATGPLSLARAFGGASQPSSTLSVQPMLFHEDPTGLQRLDYYNSPETQKALSSGDLVISQPGEDGNGGNRSVMAVPIRLQDQILGVLEFRDDAGQRRWTDDDRMLAEEITDQLALALENARLFHQAAARTQELALVNRVVSSVAGSLDLMTSLDSVASELARALSLGHASISLLSEDKSTLTLVSDQPGRLDRVQPDDFRLGQGYADSTKSHRGPRTDDLHRPERKPAAPAAPRRKARTPHPHHGPASADRGRQYDRPSGLAPPRRRP